MCKILSETQLGLINPCVTFSFQECPLFLSPFPSDLFLYVTSPNIVAATGNRNMTKYLIISFILITFSAEKNIS